MSETCLHKSIVFIFFLSPDLLISLDTNSPLFTCKLILIWDIRICSKLGVVLKPGGAADKVNVDTSKHKAQEQETQSWKEHVLPSNTIHWEVS